MTGPSRLRPAWAEIDLAAVRHNAAVLAATAAPATLCAVVKADGYGHGAAGVARAAVQGGAHWLAVATVDEGVALRDAGIDVPVLLLSEPAPEAMAEAHARALVPTVYSRQGIRAAARAVGAAAAAAADGARGAGDGEAAALPWAVHVKVDTGMHRVGCDPGDLPGVLAALVAEAPALSLGGLWTHLAVADGVAEADRAFTAGQLRCFDAAVASAAAASLAVPLRHAANSAGTMVHPGARLDLVRCGIALYGLAPGPGLAGRTDELGLRPALTWKARVAHVRRLPAGARPSYGRARPLATASTVAVVPVGYADGVPRAAFGAGVPVLIGGRPRPLAGVVTMDQLVVDCGDDPVAVGDEVVLVGRQGEAVLTAWDWAGALGTIAYEVVCGIGPRVPRVVVDEPAMADMQEVR